MPRYFFVLPDVDKPTGGNAVAMQMAQILRAEGYDAGVVNGTDSYKDRFFEGDLQPYFYPPLTKIPRHFMSRRQKISQTARSFFKHTPRGTNLRLHVQPDDIFIIPELWYPEYSALFPNNKRILFSQHIFSFCTAIQRDQKLGVRYLDEFQAIITISEATESAIELFTQKKTFVVAQSIARSDLNPMRLKKRQIAYMPRKRPKDASILETYIQNNPAFRNWDICRIENVALKKVDEILSESLIFLSLSHEEGFGLPPAEAMAAGCIVIGYTGVGGEEFFQRDTGITILDGDIAAFARKLGDVVSEYDSDSTRLDELRHYAAEHIANRYNPDSMKKTLLSAWKAIDEIVSE